MKNFAPNSKGFISLTMIFVLTTFMTLYFTAAFAIALSQQQDYVRSTCVQEANKIQISTLKNARALFATNPVSTSLRIGIRTTQIAMALAILNPPLLAQLTKTLNDLYRLQNLLDKYQKGLILKAQIDLAAKQAALVVKVNSGQYNTAYNWRSMLKMLSVFTPSKMSTFAVRPDSQGGVGPNYEWEENAETKLTLAYSWNMFFATKEPLQKLLTWTNVLGLKCSVAPDLKEQKWRLKINAVK